MANVAQGMVSRGHAVDVVLASGEGSLIAELPSEIRVVDLGAGRMIKSLLPLVRYLRQTEPRVIVPQMNHSNLLALWASRLAGRGTPVVAVVHNSLSQTSRQARGIGDRAGTRLLRTFYPWAARVVAVSQGAADDLVHVAKLPPELIEVIYNPVITPSFLARLEQRPDHPWFTDAGVPVILGAGRLTQQKDFGTLIRAFAELRRRRPARLLIVGEGSDRGLLEALVAELGLGEDVALPGWRSDVAGCMAHADVFVLSSAWEGLPTVLIEALASGTRIVSTDCRSGPREILQRGRLGALVPVGDPAALAEAIYQALERERQPAPMDALAPFTEDAAVEHYLRVIDDV